MRLGAGRGGGHRLNPLNLAIDPRRGTREWSGKFQAVSYFARGPSTYSGFRADSSALDDAWEAFLGVRAATKR